MDSTAYTLLLAMGAAVCAAFISGWLLHMMVPAALFWAVLVVNLVMAPTGLFVPWYCSRQRQWRPVVPTINIFLAAMLSILVSIGIVVFERLMNDKVSGDQVMTDQFVRTLIALCGIAMATSLVFFLLHYNAVHEAADIRRLYRRLRRLVWWAPKAKLVLVDDLATVAPGDCAICLDALANIPAELAVAPACGSKAQAHSVASLGLLRLPCQHTYHSYCADRWMAREVNCPMCRQPIGNLNRCVRYCLRPDAALPEAPGGDEEAGAAGAGGAGGSSAGAGSSADRPRAPRAEGEAEGGGEAEGCLLRGALEPIGDGEGGEEAGGPSSAEAPVDPERGEERPTEVARGGRIIASF